MICCDFCGLEFDPTCADQSCQGCPLAKACSRITCPRCGYQMLPEAKLVSLVSALNDRFAAWIKRRSTAIVIASDFDKLERID